MRNVLVIGNENFDERMYPHTYDVLRILEEACALRYCPHDDRGRNRFNLGTATGSGRRIVEAYIRGYRTGIRVASEMRRQITAELDAIIAIDHSALHYATTYASPHTKVVFWSHDFFSPDHPWMRSFFVRRLVAQNRKNIQRCDMIVSQDHNRAAALDSILMSHDISRVYVPVSVFGADSPTPRRRVGSSKTLMQLGSIHPARDSDGLLRHYQTMPSEIRLVFKGDVAIEMKESLASAKRCPVVFPRSDRMQEMRADIDKADIGLIACSQKNLNNHFFSRASGQLVEFLRLKIPVIVIDMPELGEFVTGVGCGVHIRAPDELSDAVSAIDGRYEQISRNAFAAFTKHFDIDKYRSTIAEIVS